MTKPTSPDARVPEFAIMPFIHAPLGSNIALETPEGRIVVELYSEAGIQLVSQLWLKLCAEYKLMYQPTWMGIPIIQLPSDIIMMQELLWKVRPDAVVECGLAHGGSAVLYASVLEIFGRGRVIGIDVEVHEQNRLAIENHPLSHRIEIIEGSSVQVETFDKVRSRAEGAETVLVVLDSNHSRAHVGRELELYHRLVTSGSYLVVMDAAQGQVWDIPRGKREWRDDNPFPAIMDFLEAHPEFAVDTYYNRLRLTSNPNGFLRRRTVEEMRRT